MSHYERYSAGDHHAWLSAQNRPAPPPTDATPDAVRAAEDERFVRFRDARDALAAAEVPTVELHREQHGFRRVKSFGRTYDEPHTELVPLGRCWIVGEFPWTWGTETSRRERVLTAILDDDPGPSTYTAQGGLTTVRYDAERRAHLVAHQAATFHPPAYPSVAAAVRALLDR